ncbi:hypothetical protein TNCV_4993861 [Trichonephila clavipes]|nr:hypothetical protein TNCV_4993861 [Trichonephila clavipes]
MKKTQQIICRNFRQILKKTINRLNKSEDAKVHVQKIQYFLSQGSAAVAEWYRHRIVAGFVTSSSPVPLKTRRVGQR